MSLFHQESRAHLLPQTVKRKRITIIRRLTIILEIMARTLMGVGVEAPVREGAVARKTSRDAGAERIQNLWQLTRFRSLESSRRSTVCQTQRHSTLKFTRQLHRQQRKVRQTPRKVQLKSSRIKKEM